MKHLPLVLRLQRLAKVNDAKYLVQLNLRALSQDKPKDIANPRDFYQGLQTKAQEGPIFSKSTIHFLEQLDLDLSKDEVQWLANCHKAKQLGSDAIEHVPSVLDYIRSEKPNLHDLAFADALADSARWHEQFHGKSENAGSYKTNEEVLNLGTHRWVAVPLEDLETEGSLMGHCVGSGMYDKGVKSGKTKIFSLRDRKNQPHVTVEITNDKLRQVQGKENKQPVEKYHDAVIALIRHLKVPHNEHSVPFAREPKLLRQFSKSKNSNIRRVTLTKKNLPPEIFRRMLRKGTAYDKAQIARNPHLPKEMFQELAEVETSTSALKVNIACNESAPPEVLKQLSKHNNPTVVNAVASNPGTPSDVLRYLFKRAISGIPDRETATRVLSNLSDNKNLPTDVISELIGHASEVLRAYIADNPSLSADDQYVLARDRSDEVRESLAGNKHLSNPKAMQLLAKDTEDYVRETVASQPNLTKDVALILTEDKDEQTRAALARHTKFPEVLVKLGRDERTVVLIAVAKNVHTPTEILKLLSGNPKQAISSPAKTQLKRRTDA